MPKWKARFEDKTLVLPKRSEILSDFRLLRVIRGVARVPEKRTTDKTGNRHGDAAVAAVMLVDAREQRGNVEPWECETVGIPGGVSFRLEATAPACSCAMPTAEPARRRAKAPAWPCGQPAPQASTPYRKAICNISGRPMRGPAGFVPH